MDMMLRILGFVAIALLGFFSVSLVLYGSLNLGLIDALPAEEHLQSFKLYYLGGSGMVWAAATLIGLTSFFMQGLARKIVLFIPLVAPLAYCIGALLYFSRLQ